MSDPFQPFDLASWAPPPPPWQPPSRPPRPERPGVVVVVLAFLVAGLLVAGAVGAAVSGRRGSDATGPTSPSPPHPTGAPGTSSPTPSTTVAPTTTTKPLATRPRAVAPVSPLSVPPQTTVPITPRPLTVPAPVIAARVDPSIVDIDTRLQYQHAIAAGTGMLLTSTGVVLTNNHVIDGATTIAGVAVGNGRTYGAHVIGVDPSDDIAVLQLDGASGLATVTTGSSGVSPGDAVVAIGNAGGAGGAPSVTTGTVEATDQSIVATDPGTNTSEQLDGLIESSATLQPGDSGGPLVNGSGQIIGMDTAASVASGSSMVSFAIPIDKALAVAQQIESGVAGSGIYFGLPPFLGVAVEPGTVAGRTGPVVRQLLPGGPATAAGVTVGSLITAVNGEVIDSSTSLAAVLRQFRPGESVTLAWLDPLGGAHNVRVTLGTGPAD